MISNGVDTKYYANSQKQSFKFTSFWGDEKNKKITQLDKFASIFLEPCHIAKMITKYIVLHESDKILIHTSPTEYSLDSLWEKEILISSYHSTRT